MSDFTPAVPLSVRIPPKMRDELDELAEATGRSKSFLATEALDNYLSVQVWQVKAIKEAMEKIDNGSAKFISHERVGAWIESWGTDNELEMPV